MGIKEKGSKGEQRHKSTLRAERGRGCSNFPRKGFHPCVGSGDGAEQGISIDTNGTEPAQTANGDVKVFF